VPVDATALEASIRQLQGKVPNDSDLEAAVRSAVDVVGELCRCSGAGLLLVDDAGTLRYVAGSDDVAARLVAAEERAGEGPATDAVAAEDVVDTADVARDSRWPALAALLGDGPTASVVASPVRVGEAVVGSLEVHGDPGVAWEPDAVEAVRSYARVIEAVLAPAVQARRNGEVVSQLQYALDHRVVVERAVGYLMASDDVDARSAFERLRSAARSRRRQVSDLAAGLLEGESLDQS
jgi:transcriptional regulator with GAF, ATPase, and Fis domain